MVSRRNFTYLSNMKQRDLEFLFLKKKKLIEFEFFVRRNDAFDERDWSEWKGYNESRFVDNYFNFPLIGAFHVRTNARIKDCSRFLPRVFRLYTNTLPQYLGRIQVKGTGYELTILLLIVVSFYLFTLNFSL